jgi:hypothetical protein
MKHVPTHFSHRLLPNGLTLSTCLFCSKVTASRSSETLQVAEYVHHDYCVARQAEQKRGKTVKVKDR